MNYNFLANTRLFKGILPSEMENVLNCLNSYSKTYQKNETIFRSGQTIDVIGLVLSGGVSIESNDLWGNKTILDYVTPGLIFAEAYACLPYEELLIDVVASEKSEILFLNINNLTSLCNNACSYHNKLISNLLMISSSKNLNLARRSLHTSSKSIRTRIISYLSYEVKKQGKYDLYLPFDRQQLADYLNINRSALSNELSKMSNEGYIKFEKNHFIISNKIASENI